MLAVGIKDDWVRYAQADIEDQSLVLNLLDGHPLPAELKSFDQGSPEMAGEFQKLFQGIVSSSSVPDRDVYVSLGEEWIECLLLEADGRLTDEGKEGYLNWILKQRLGTLWDDTVAFFQDEGNGGNKSPQVLSCLALRGLIEVIKSAVNATGGRPRWMESSVQSIGRVVAKMDPGPSVSAVVMEPHAGGYGVQFYDRGQLRSLAELRLQSGKFRDRYVKGDSAFAKQCLSNLNHLVHGGGSEPVMDFHLFLVGEFSDKQLEILLPDDYSDSVTLVHPFSHMRTGKIKLPDTPQGSWFVHVLGLLLLELD
ncbi:MAG: hypothetical protein V3U24_01125 [Candidatus Neomarinimicrobiota bacterium]